MIRQSKLAKDTIYKHVGVLKDKLRMSKTHTPAIAHHERLVEAEEKNKMYCTTAVVLSVGTGVEVLGEAQSISREAQAT